MVQKRETNAINKLCVREILSLSFVCGAYFFEFHGRNLVCFVIAYNLNGKFTPKAGKTRMRTAFFTRAQYSKIPNVGLYVSYKITVTQISFAIKCFSIRIAQVFFFLYEAIPAGFPGGGGGMGKLIC